MKNYYTDDMFHKRDCQKVLEVRRLLCSCLLGTSKLYHYKHVTL